MVHSMLNNFLPIVIDAPIVLSFGMGANKSSSSLSDSHCSFFYKIQTRMPRVAVYYGKKRLKSLLDILKILTVNNTPVKKHAKIYKARQLHLSHE